MDNFPSFTVLRPLPNWYEGEDAGRARCVQPQEGDGTKTGENKGVWEFQDAQDPASWPGLRDAWNESAENWEKVRGVWGVWAAGAPGA